MESREEKLHSPWDGSSPDNRVTGAQTFPAWSHDHRHLSFKPLPIKILCHKTPLQTMAVKTTIPSIFTLPPRVFLMLRLYPYPKTKTIQIRSMYQKVCLGYATIKNGIDVTILSSGRYMLPWIVSLLDLNTSTTNLALMERLWMSHNINYIMLVSQRLSNKSE